MHRELKVRHKAGQSGVFHQTWEWTLWHTPLSAFRAAGASANPGTQPTPGDPVEEPDTGDSSGLTFVMQAQPLRNWPLKGQLGWRSWAPHRAPGSGSTRAGSDWLGEDFHFQEFCEMVDVTLMA